MAMELAKNVVIGDAAVEPKGRILGTNNFLRRWPININVDDAVFKGRCLRSRTEGILRDDVHERTVVWLSGKRRAQVDVVSDLLQDRGRFPLISEVVFRHWLLGRNRSEVLSYLPIFKTSF